MKKISVTPVMAAKMLESQRVNRNISKSTVSKYRMSMESGDWIASEALAILIDSDGRLVDGQHRLMAVCELGQPVSMYVNTITDDVLAAFHEIRARTTTDKMIIDGAIPREFARTVSGVGIALHHWHHDGNMPVTTRMGFGYCSLSVKQVLSIYADLKIDPNALARKANEAFALQPRLARPASAIIIGILLAQQAYGVEEFVHEFCVDAGVTRRESVKTARRQLLNTVYSPTAKLGILSRAFNDSDLKTIRIGTKVEPLRGGMFQK